MKLRFTERADKDYAGLQQPIRKAFAKQLGFGAFGACRGCLYLKAPPTYFW